MKRVGRVLVAVIVLAALLGLGIWLTFFRGPDVGRLQAELVNQLVAWFGQEASLESFDVTLRPSLSVRGEGLTVGSGPEPLIRVARFDVDANPRELFDEPRRIRSVTLDGLEVFVSRKPKDDGDEESRKRPRGAPAILIDEVVAENAVVSIASSDPEKLPRVYRIPRLRVTPVDPTGSMDYEALVVNPKPTGEVDAKGSFGPWDVDSPRFTPIRGDFVFRDADMATIKSLGGFLTAEGTFEGSLDQMDVVGRAQIPDFALTIGDINPLDVDFETTVGDKGGDIRLTEVDTRFRSSRLVASGSIVRSVEVKGRQIELDVSGKDSRIEDMVRFAVRADEPPISGDIVLDTKVVIPPGEGPVLDKIRIAGTFDVAEATFANLDVQKTLAKVSRVTGGAVEGESGRDVVSDLEGRFEIRNAVIEFQELRFAVPGMKVELVGTYGLRDQELDLRGRILTERAPSQMVGGRLSDWLRILDPVLSGGETVGMSVPITIEGPRNKPSFRPDWSAMTDDWKDRLKGLIAPPNGDAPE